MQSQFRMSWHRIRKKAGTFLIQGSALLVLAVSCKSASFPPLAGDPPPPRITPEAERDRLKAVLESLAAPKDEPDQGEGTQSVRRKDLPGTGKTRDMPETAPSPGPPSR